VARAEAKIVVSADVLLQEREVPAVASPHEVESSGSKTLAVPGDARVRIALVGIGDRTRAQTSGIAKTGQAEDTPIAEMFEKRLALYILELARGASPIAQFAQGVGELGEAEVVEIA
jgi:hypothetical protein